MALIAENAADRAEQLILITERLTALIEDEAQRIDRREMPATGEEAEEKTRLANAYRLELARIKQEPALIREAPPRLLAKLKDRTKKLQGILSRHEIALGAVKLVAEGLVQAMAEATVRIQAGARGYGETGGIEPAAAPIPTVIDRSA